MLFHTQVNADTEVELKKLVKAEDIEEISDEEAEWSDDGDCMFPLDFDADFETEEECESDEFSDQCKWSYSRCQSSFLDYHINLQ